MERYAGITVQPRMKAGQAEESLMLRERNSKVVLPSSRLLLECQAVSPIAIGPAHSSVDAY